MWEIILSPFPGQCIHYNISESLIFEPRLFLTTICRFYLFTQPLPSEALYALFRPILFFTPTDGAGTTNRKGPPSSRVLRWLFPKKKIHLLLREGECSPLIHHTLTSPSIGQFHSEITDIISYPSLLDTRKRDFTVENFISALLSVLRIVSRLDYLWVESVSRMHRTDCFENCSFTLLPSWRRVVVDWRNWTLA